MRSIAFAALAAFMLTACEKPANAPLAPPSQADAEKIVTAAEASYGSGDANAVMAHYGDGAVIFDPGVLAPTRDRQMQTKWTQGFVAMQPADFTVSDRNIQVLDTDSMVSSGILAFTARVGPARERVRTRFTHVYQRQPDGSWKIVHEHMSLPPAGSPAP